MDEWYVCALFLSDREYINKHCIVISKLRHANFVVSLNGWLWDVRPLVTEKIYIHCMMETHIWPTPPPLTIIPIKNGCEGYSSNI